MRTAAGKRRPETHVVDSVMHSLPYVPLSIIGRVWLGQSVGRYRPFPILVCKPVVSGR